MEWCGETLDYGVIGASSPFWFRAEMSTLFGISFLAASLSVLAPGHHHGVRRTYEVE
jgi:hypothetical protein